MRMREGSVAARNIGVDMVQCVVSSGGDVDVLVESRQNSSEVYLIKIPSNNNYSFWMDVTADDLIQFLGCIFEYASGGM